MFNKFKLSRLFSRPNEWLGLDKQGNAQSLFRKSHSEKLVQSIEDQLECLNLEVQIEKVFHHPSNEQIEKIDETITSILNTTTKIVEGMKRNIHFSQENKREE